MIRTDETKGKSIKAMREKEKQEKDQILKEKCNAFANEKYGEQKLVELSNKNKGLFYLPVLDEDGNIEKMALLKPIDRHILSYASTKIEDEGLYAFLEAVLKECWIDGDMEIQENDEYFIPAVQTLNKIIEGKKAALLKR